MTDPRGIRDEVPNEELYHDEETWQKVYQSLVEAGVAIRPARYAMTLMRNKGILFRERKKRND